MYNQWLLTLTLTIPFVLFAADSAIDHAMIHRDSATPFDRFDSQSYANYTFATPEPWGPGGLAKCRRKTVGANRYNSRKDPFELKKKLDFVHALREIELSDFINKPASLWTLEDLKHVNGWLTRLHPKVETPGALRTINVRQTIITKLTRKQQERFETLKKYPYLMTKADERMFKQTTHLYPDHTEVFDKTELMLSGVHAALNTLETDKVGQLNHHELNIVGFLHLHINSIRPWPKRNKATARILGNIILMQHGIKSLIFPDRKAYLRQLCLSLKTNNFRPLTVYMRNLIIARQQQETQKASTSGTTN